MRKMSSKYQVQIMKNSKILVMGVLLTVIGSAALAKGKKDQEMDIEIIHKPPSEPFTLYVTATSLRGHLKHGDCIVEKNEEEDPYQAMVQAQVLADAELFPYEVIFCEPVDDDDDDDDLPD